MEWGYGIWICIVSWYSINRRWGGKKVLAKRILFSVFDEALVLVPSVLILVRVGM
jgi:hypothetical protein